MLLEMVDVLRCTAPHEDSPLVASISRRADRDIVSGMLGCSVCLSEYPIVDGIAIFGDGPGQTPELPRDAYAELPEEMAVRCAAMLDLYDPGGVIVLGGGWGVAAAELVEMTRTLVFLIEPPAGVRLGTGIAAVRIGGLLPFAPGSIRGIALDRRTSMPSLVSSAARALKPRGRLIASATAPVPAGVAERARDDNHWVAEAGAVATAPIRLVRSRESDSPQGG